jgi:methionyl-tRNA formyltransferase
MKITVLCSSPDHPVFAHLSRWVERQSGRHEARLVTRAAQADMDGDILFLISCTEIIRAPLRARYRASLVVHASDLPRGRGWSPHIWDILNGADHLTVSLLEAGDKVDTGAIWQKLTIPLEGHELFDEINKKLFAAELALMDYAVENIDVVKPMPQPEEGATHYPRRDPSMSRLDPERPIAEQFDLLRVCDPDRFPAYFDWRGHRYKLTIEKMDKP